MSDNHECAWMLFFMLLLEINGVVETLLVCGNVGGHVWLC
jgi:hypothetical protein